MADAVGSRAGLAQLAPRLRGAGVEVVPMLQVGFFRHNAARFDLRNHRKLAAIDGLVGYAGSQNIVDANFVPGHPNEELVARVTGPVVAQIQAVLVADHFIETGGTLEATRFFPNIPPGVEGTFPRRSSRAARVICARMAPNFSSPSSMRLGSGSS